MTCFESMPNARLKVKLSNSRERCGDLCQAAQRLDYSGDFRTFDLHFAKPIRDDEITEARDNALFSEDLARFSAFLQPLRQIHYIANSSVIHRARCSHVADDGLAHVQANTER